MPEGLHRAFFARTVPVVSAILVTRPLHAAELARHRWRTDDTFINSRRVMNYYRRLPDRRLLFGGRGHTKGHLQGEQQTYQRLAESLHAMFPAWSDVDIEYRWHGLICYTRKLCPSLGQLEEDPSVFFAFGYHGNGVNTATWSGKQLADWIGQGREPGLPAIVKGLGPRFRPAALRLQFLQLGIGISSWLDRRSEA